MEPSSGLSELALHFHVTLSWQRPGEVPDTHHSVILAKALHAVILQVCAGNETRTGLARLKF